MILHIESTQVMETRWGGTNVEEDKVKSYFMEEFILCCPYTRERVLFSLVVMSSSTHEQMASPTGHATRAVLSSERRNEIWENVYEVAMQPPNTGRWCTREELMKLTMAQTPLKFTVQELTEVLRGKKHKSALGVESMKKDGEHHHRFIMPGNAASPSDSLDLPMSVGHGEIPRTSASTVKTAVDAPKAVSTPSSSKKRKPARPSSTSKDAVAPKSKSAKVISASNRNGSPPKPQENIEQLPKSEVKTESSPASVASPMTPATPTTPMMTCEPTTPRARPRAGAARSTSSKSPGVKSSRKRRLHENQPTNEEQEETSPSIRSTTAKRHRTPAETKTVKFSETISNSYETSGEQARDGGGGGAAGAGAKPKGSGSWCMIM